MYDQKLLKRAVESGIIDLNSLSAQIEEMEKNKILKEHKWKIWQGKNGRYMTYVEDSTRQDGRRLLSKKSREDLEEAIVNVKLKREKAPTVGRCFEWWLEDKRNYGEIKDVTYYKYRETYKRFMQNNPISKCKIKNIDSHDLEAFVKGSIHDYNLTSKGWADLRTILYGTFRYAKRHDYTDLSITYVIADMDIGRKIFKPRRFNDEEQVFTEEETKRIFNYVFHHDKPPTILMLGVVLAFQTGLRVGEISTLKYSDLVNDILYVCRTETKVKENNKWAFQVCERTKGRDGERKVVLTESAQKTLRMARMMTMDCEWLFSKDGKRIESKQYTRCLYRICDILNIPRRSMHKARKTYATTLLDAGVSPRIIMNQMGHTMIETTEAYYHFNNKKVDQVKEILTESLIV